jgi:threonine synthase
LGVSALCGDGVSEKVIVLETALPVKFEDTMKEALGFTPPVPTKFEGVLNQNQLITFMTTNVDLVKEFIKAHT